MKKCLLIAPLFNEYFKDIMHELNKLGYNVTFERDQPSDTTFSFFIKRISRKYFTNKITSYVKRKILTYNDDFELVIIILAYSFIETNIKNIREHFSKARFVYYTWDSIENFPIIKSFFKYFDKVYSFDKRDCNQYDLNFLPLFYTKKSCKESRRYDYSLIMSLYPTKVKAYLDIVNRMPKDINGFKYIVVKSRLFFLYYKIRYFRLFSHISFKDVKFKTLKRSEVYKIFEDSNVVLDLPLEKQNGLTIRTFESLALGCKLITTNINIIDYDFYDEDKILILKKDSKFTKDYFKSISKKPFDEKNEYTVEKFVRKLILK